MEKTERATLRQRWRNVFWLTLLLLGGVAGYACLAMNGVAIPCIFYWLTGLECPGCGNTRAALALLRLDIPAALAYNCVAPLEFFYIGWVLFFSVRHYIKNGRFSYRPPCAVFDACVLGALLLWGILRNIFVVL